MDPDKKYKDMLKENPYLSIQKPEDVSGVIDRYEHAKKDEACWQVKELFSDFVHVMNVCNELSSFRLESMVLTLIRESWKKKSKTRDRHRARFAGKKSRAQHCIILYMFPCFGFFSGNRAW